MLIFDDVRLVALKLNGVSLTSFEELENVLTEAYQVQLTKKRH